MRRRRGLGIMVGSCFRGCGLGSGIVFVGLSFFGGCLFVYESLVVVEVVVCRSGGELEMSGEVDGFCGAGGEGGGCYLVLTWRGMEWSGVYRTLCWYCLWNALCEDSD